jgi:aromatic ring-opening dioxygenase catalytic subunit (LigB family)
VKYLRAVEAASYFSLITLKLFANLLPPLVLGDPSQAAIAKSLQTRVPSILKLGTPEAPRAIVLVTAHWSTDVPTISSAEKHDLLYDYYGFPPEAYKLKYNAPGSPEVAGLVKGLLEEAGIKGEQDLGRGTCFCYPSFIS